MRANRFNSPPHLGRSIIGFEPMPEDVRFKTPGVGGIADQSVRVSGGIGERHVAVEVLLIQLSVGRVVDQGKQPRYRTEVPDPTGPHHRSHRGNHGTMIELRPHPEH